MNSVNLVGRLVGDNELRYTDSQVAVLKNRVAINRPTDREKADFINITSFGKTAELIDKYTAKGKLIAISGRLQTGQYENKEGRKVYTTDVIVERVQFIDWKDKAEDIPAGFESINEEDLPF